MPLSAFRANQGQDGTADDFFRRGRSASIFGRENVFHCAAHRLNLAVNDALEEKQVKEIVEIRNFVSAFTSSSKNIAKLKAVQQKTKVAKPLTLLLSNKTRLSSTYAMLDRVMKLEKYLFGRTEEFQQLEFA